MTHTRTEVRVWSPGLATAARLLDDVLAGRADRRPAVPSAGAIHPFEVFVMAHGDHLVHADAANRVCRVIPADPRWFHAVHDQGLDDPGEHGAHLLVLVRPWLSMRKYGLRGYDYGLLDASHLATALLGAPLSAGADATLRIRLPRTGLRELLGRSGQFREIHSVISLHDPAPAPAPGWRPWRVEPQPPPRPPLGEPAGGPGLVAELESMCWRRISASARTDPGYGMPATRPLASVSGPAAVPPRLLHGAWAGLARSRRSSRSFGQRPLPADAVDRIVAAAGTPLPTDLADRADLLRVRAYRPERAGAGPRARIVDACLGQQHLGAADTFVLFHTPRAGHLPRSEALLRAGAAAHLIYLAAAAAGATVTAIGGFDAAEWAALGGVPDGDEVVYLMALGTPGDSVAKIDRHSWTQGIDR